MIELSDLQISISQVNSRLSSEFIDENIPEFIGNIQVHCYRNIYHVINGEGAFITTDSVINGRCCSHKSAVPCDIDSNAAEPFLRRLFTGSVNRNGYLNRNFIFLPVREMDPAEFIADIHLGIRVDCKLFFNDFLVLFTSFCSFYSEQEDGCKRDCQNFQHGFHDDVI